MLVGEQPGDREAQALERVDDLKVVASLLQA
jgi:hypothetical protein